MFDLLRRSMDHRIDVLRDVERGRGPNGLQRLQVCSRPRLGLELLELGEQGGVVSGIGDGVHDARDLILFALDRGTELGPCLVR